MKTVETAGVSARTPTQDRQKAMLIMMLMLVALTAFFVLQSRTSQTTTTTRDTIHPAAIADLAATGPTTSSINLTWTAPGDDGMSGTATGYLVKYSNSGPITDANWVSATNYTQSWTPLLGGRNESHAVSGLRNATRYWFAVEAYDEVPNYGGVSNSPSFLTLDAFPPATITNLVMSNATAISITLMWTAPGDNGTLGTATGYVAKYSTSAPVTDASWASATTYIQSWVPLPAGSTETHTVSGLAGDTVYWFAIRAFDEVPNYAKCSNSPAGKTLDTVPPSTITDLAASGPTENSITLTWTAPGDNGLNGSATGYLVKYSTSGPITAANLTSAMTYTQSWTPPFGGGLETHILEGLNPGTKYWFAIEAYDEVPNYGNISNSPNATTLAPPDNTPPATISNLATSNPTNTSITLTWTAPGDDGLLGNATGYVVKYSTLGPITDANWASATTYAQSWIPLLGGNAELHVVSGLAPSTTYWFAVKAYDEVMNYGVVSNTPSLSTTDTLGAVTGSEVLGVTGLLVITAAVAAISVVVALVYLESTRSRSSPREFKAEKEWKTDDVKDGKVRQTERVLRELNSQLAKAERSFSEALEASIAKSRYADTIDAANKAITEYVNIKKRAMENNERKIVEICEARIRELKELIIEAV